MGPRVSAHQAVAVASDSSVKITTYLLRMKNNVLDVMEQTSNAVVDDVATIFICFNLLSPMPCAVTSDSTLTTL